jgi:hypothetical protein
VLTDRGLKLLKAVFKDIPRRECLARAQDSSVLRWHQFGANH